MLDERRDHCCDSRAPVWISYRLRMSNCTKPRWNPCYGVGGQHYGTLDGWLRGKDVRGELRLTNLAPRRPDNVNLPTLRGLLTTEDDALVYVEMNGIATLHASLIVTSNKAFAKAHLFAQTFARCCRSITGSGLAVLESCS
jgi:hypothetical protein